MSTRSEFLEREVADLPELLGRATGREALADNAGKSGAYIERLALDGQRYVVKYLDLTQDLSLIHI